MKCKVIRNKSTKSVESDINDFLQGNPSFKIIHVTQTTSHTSVVLTTIFYEE
jgi:hypothetical protein